MARVDERASLSATRSQQYLRTKEQAIRRTCLIILAAFVVILAAACTTVYQLDLASGQDQNRSVYTQYPNYVNMLVRVTNGKITTTDANGNVIPDFSNPEYYVVGLEPTADGQPKGNFSVLENNVEVKVEAGLRVQPLEELALHINVLLDVSGSIGEAGLVQAKNAVKRLIARPATPAEIAADDPELFSYSYRAYDTTAKSFAQRNEIWKPILKENQIVTIYTFSDTVTKVALREHDASGKRYPDKARQLLDTIDRNISLGVDSTNLYGALLAGLNDLSAVRTLSDPTRGFVDGVVVAFTDGSHTSGNIQYRGETLTPKQAIARIRRLRGDLTDLQSLRVITIAVRTPELQETIRTGDLTGGGLRDIQNAGYLRVDNYSALKDRFTEAFELIDRFTRSLYWIYYRSPKSGFQTVNIDLRVNCNNCEKDENGDIPSYARIRESVQTNGFYQVLPGVFINDPILDDQGRVANIPDSSGNNAALLGPQRIELMNNPSTQVTSNRLYSQILANNPDQIVMNPENTEMLRIHTYVRANDNRYKPQYTITSSDPSVVAIIGYSSLTAIESVALIEGRKNGVATIRVVDTANGNLQDTIVVESRITE